jgi:hypothetical protein
MVKKSKSELVQGNLSEPKSQAERTLNKGRTQGKRTFKSFTEEEKREFWAKEEQNGEVEIIPPSGDGFALDTSKP